MNYAFNTKKHNEDRFICIGATTRFVMLMVVFTDRKGTTRIVTAPLGEPRGGFTSPASPVRAFRPKDSRFRAALRSRSCRVWHTWHSHCRRCQAMPLCQLMVSAPSMSKMSSSNLTTLSSSSVRTTMAPCISSMRLLTMVSPSNGRLWRFHVRLVLICWRAGFPCHMFSGMGSRKASFW